MFGQQDCNLKVFNLLETSCLALSVMATKWQKLQKGGSPEHLVYKRMVWGMLLACLWMVAIVLFFDSQCCSEMPL